MNFKTGYESMYSNKVYQQMWQLLNYRKIIHPIERSFKGKRVRIHCTSDGSGYRQFIWNQINLQHKQDWDNLGEQMCEQKWMELIRTAPTDNGVEDRDGPKVRSKGLSLRGRTAAGK